VVVNVTQNKVRGPLASARRGRIPPMVSASAQPIDPVVKIATAASTT